MESFSSSFLFLSLFMNIQIGAKSSRRWYVYMDHLCAELRSYVLARCCLSPPALVWHAMR